MLRKVNAREDRREVGYDIQLLNQKSRQLSFNSFVVH